MHYNSIDSSNLPFIYISMNKYKKTLENINPNDYFNMVDIFKIIMDLAESIQIIHNLSLIHGNIKPTNILFDEEANVILSDYFKKELFFEVQTPPVTLEEYKYLSPELIQCKEFTSKTDIWSFGCVIYYILTGKSIFQGYRSAKIHKSIFRLKYSDLIIEDESCNISKELIQKMIQLDDDKRYDINQVIEALNKLKHMKKHYLVEEERKSHLVENNLTSEAEELIVIPKPQIVVIEEVKPPVEEEDHEYLITFEELQRYIEGNEVIPNDILEQLKFSENEYDEDDDEDDEHSDKYKHIMDLINRIIEEYNKTTNEGYLFLLVNIIWNNYNDKLKRKIQSKLKFSKTINGCYDDDIDIDEVTIEGVNNSFELYYRWTYFGEEGANYISNNFKHIYNIISLNLNDNNLKENELSILCKNFSLIPNLNHLFLARNGIGNDEMIYLCQNLNCISNLIELSLGDNNLEDDGLKTLTDYLSYITNLKSLDLSNNSITYKSISVLSDSLSNISLLKSLNISNNIINDIGIIKLCNDMSILSHLNILTVYENPITDNGVIALSNYLQVILYNNTLLLNNLEMGDDGLIAVCKYLSKLTTLNTLNLSNNTITSLNIECLTNSIPILPQLKNILISNNPIGRDGLIKFDSNIRYLIEDDNDKKLLCLDSMKLYNSGIFELCSNINRLIHINILSLNNNCIEKDGIECLCQYFKDFSQLECLKLGSNRMKDDGMKILSEYITDLTVLTDLSVNNNNLSDDSVSYIEEILKQNSKISNLNINDNNISLDFIHKLCTDNPNIKFT